MLDGQVCIRTEIKTDLDPHKGVADPKHWYRTVCIMYRYTRFYLNYQFFPLDLA